MIIKTKDPIEPALTTLEALKAEASPHQRKRIDTEIRRMKAGASGESSSGYHIDFYYGPTDNWAVIHDLRLEHKGRVAQIDHLLISRTLECFVLESKHFSDTLEINDRGEFTARWGRDTTGIESPIQQNERHIAVLKQCIADEGLGPKRIIRLPIDYRSIVLVSPKSKIKRPRSGIDTSMIIKADLLKAYIDKVLDGTSTLTAARIVSQGTLREFAERLAAKHCPKEIDYRAKFGIGEPEPVEQEAEKPVVVASEPTEEAKPKQKSGKGFFCAGCKVKISPKVAKFCFDRKDQFGGRAYCMDCQLSIKQRAKS